MIIKTIELHNFRNYETLRIDFERQIFWNPRMSAGRQSRIREAATRK